MMMKNKITVFNEGGGILISGGGAYVRDTVLGLESKREAELLLAVRNLTVFARVTRVPAVTEEHRDRVLALL